MVLGWTRAHYHMNMWLTGYYGATESLVCDPKLRRNNHFLIIQ